MAKLSDEIFEEMKASRGAKKAPPAAADDLEAEDVDDEDEEYAGDGETAMQEFMDAEDAAGKLAAFKALMKICSTGEE